MTSDNTEIGRPAPGSRQTTISGNNNSGLIAGGDVRGGVTLNSGPPPVAPAAAGPSLPASKEAGAPAALRILFLSSSPVDAQALRFDAEVRGA